MNWRRDHCTSALPFAGIPSILRSTPQPIQPGSNDSERTHVASMVSYVDGVVGRALRLSEDRRRQLGHRTLGRQKVTRPASGVAFAAGGASARGRAARSGRTPSMYGSSGGHDTATLPR